MTDEDEIERARLRWPRRFCARVEAMARLLKRAVEDNTPTPQAIEDGEHR